MGIFSSDALLEHKKFIVATLKNMRKNDYVVWLWDRKFPPQHEHYVSCNIHNETCVNYWNLCRGVWFFFQIPDAFSLALQFDIYSICCFDKLYFPDKPPIEELQYFLDFQVPLVWAPAPPGIAGHHRKEPVCPSLQFSLMGPKLFISTEQVKATPWNPLT
jgi:hypothetical protein